MHEKRVGNRVTIHLPRTGAEKMQARRERERMRFVMRSNAAPGKRYSYELVLPRKRVHT